MKKSKFFSGLATFLVVPLLLIASFPNISNAEEINEESLAKQSVTNYIEAIQAGDINEAVNWVIDTRFDSKDDQLAQYQDASINDPFSNASIEKIEPSSDNSFIVTLNLTRKTNGELNKISLPVIESNGNWKLLIEGQETKDRNVKTEYFKQQKAVDEISPQASVNVGNYYEPFLDKGKSTYSGTFNMTSDLAVGITGWQENLMTPSSVTIRYSIVYKGVFSDDVLAETFVEGVYPQNSSAFYTTIYTGSQSSGVSLKVTNPSSLSSRFVKGYIYVNQ